MVSGIVKVLLYPFIVFSVQAVFDVDVNAVLFIVVFRLPANTHVVIMLCFRDSVEKGVISR